MRFENKSKDWGFSAPLLSNGAAYADLDNDGDLEIVTNNINERASIYRKDSDPENHQYLQIQLGKNFPVAATGAQLWVYSQGNVQFKEFNPSRGISVSHLYPLAFWFGKYQHGGQLKKSFGRTILPKLFIRFQGTGFWF